MSFESPSFSHIFLNLLRTFSRPSWSLVSTLIIRQNTFRISKALQVESVLENR